MISVFHSSSQGNSTTLTLKATKIYKTNLWPVCNIRPGQKLQESHTVFQITALLHHILTFKMSTFTFAVSYTSNLFLNTGAEILHWTAVSVALAVKQLSTFFPHMQDTSSTFHPFKTHLSEKYINSIYQAKHAYIASLVISFIHIFILCDEITKILRCCTTSSKHI